MDTLTHALSGALAVRATAPRADSGHPAWQRPAVGAIACAFPDLDVVLSAVSPLAYLTQHRGVTHSLLVLPVWALLLAWLAGLAFRRPRGWRDWYAPCAIALATHIAGDLITSFGTMIFAPLSNARFALGTTFIIDLFFTGIILGGLVGSLVFRRSRVPAVAASLALISYVGGQWVLMQRAAEVGQRYASAHGMPDAVIHALPRPPTPLNWTVVVAEGERYRYADLNLARRSPAAPPAADAGLIRRIAAAFEPAESATWHEHSRFGTGDSAVLARQAWNHPDFAFFRWFAQLPALYRIDRGNPSECVWFHDLRFRVPGRTWDPFRIGMCRDQGAPWRAYRLSGASERQALH